MATTIVLIVSSIGLAVAALLIVIGVYRNYLEPMIEEAKELDEVSPSKGVKRFIFNRIIGVNKIFVGDEYLKYLRKRLIMAGEPKNLTPEDFIVLQELWAVGFFVIGMLFFIVIGESVLWAIIFLLAGATYPIIWLRDMVAKRHRLITRALPYNLDLLTLSVEAGMDFQAAVSKVVEKGIQGPLVDELNYMLSLLKVGRTREEALRIMDERISLPAITSFVNALIQADRMGTSLGKVLRIQSETLRDQRAQRAEKLAQEAPVKMLFPLIVFIFPTVFMVLFGPIIFQFFFGEVF
ncbi:MAG: type II secretion system F family protein [Deltaproteobacteria bacterium]|nr:type II secretion system F family protein [Deltaproteobacteria bacterium]